MDIETFTVCYWADWPRCCNTLSFAVREQQLCDTCVHECNITVIFSIKIRQMSLFLTAHLLNQFLLTDSSHIYDLILIWTMHLKTQMTAGLHNTEKVGDKKCHSKKIIALCKMTQRWQVRAFITWHDNKSRQMVLGEPQKALNLFHSFRSQCLLKSVEVREAPMAEELSGNALCQM